MNDDTLLLETLGPVARITLNRPRAMNALNLAILAELERGLAELARNDEIRVVVLTGNGPAFCAGADLKQVLAGADLAPGEADFLDRANAVFGALRAFSKPVIAALNGVTMAGGLELAMCASSPIAARSSSRTPTSTPKRSAWTALPACGRDRARSHRRHPTLQFNKERHTS